MCGGRRTAALVSIPSRLSASARSLFSSTSTPPTTDVAARSKKISSSSSASLTSSTTNLASSSSSTLSVKELLPDKPLIYSPSEFLPSSSSSSENHFRCALRGRDAIVFRRRFHGDPKSLPSLLSSIASRCRHRGLAVLLGASLPSPDSLLLVYERIRGSNLALCLRNPNFTPLSTWVSRIQLAADVAQALDYVHNHAGIVHDRIKSSSIIVADPDLRGKLCHFGAKELAGGAGTRVDGTRGYIAPEVRAGAAPSEGSDVYAFGVVLLELVTGEEPVSCRLEEGTLVVSSLVESAREVIATAGEGRVRRWVDRRLRDSFPVDVAERVVRIAVECVDEERDRRPGMTKVAAKLSTMLFMSKEWAASLRLPTEISVSCAPR